MSNCNGRGRTCHKGSKIDKFVLTRKNNLPEMVFNQNSRQDFNNKKRFFEVNHDQKWCLNDNDCSNRDVCYICEKQKYTMIFYQRDQPVKAKISSLSQMPVSKAGPN